MAKTPLLLVPRTALLASPLCAPGGRPLRRGRTRRARLAENTSLRLDSWDRTARWVLAGRQFRAGRALAGRHHSHGDHADGA
jgi:hypothetical protein